jgi:uncharacterized membrane protein
MEWRPYIMIRSRLLRTFLSLVMVLTIAGSILIGQTSILAQGTPTPTPSPTVASKLKLDCPYPALAVQSGQSFAFEIDVKLTGIESKLFNLSTTSLDGWKVTTTAASSGKEVSAVQITPYDDPTYPVTETIIVTLAPYTQIYPAPGDYTITFKASSDTLTESINLKGTVLPQYAFILTTETENLYNVYQNSAPTIYINEGKDSLFSFNIVNKGSATIEKLAMASTVPAGWKVAFTPETADSLGSDMMQQIGATITPPSGENAAGDYLMKFKAGNGAISTTMDVRVTVVKSTFPVWAQMIIIAAAVVVLAVVYQRFFNKPRAKPAAAK